MADEAILFPAQLHIMDGNFSAKWLNDLGSADPWMFESDYFIPVDDIEQFRNNAFRNPGKGATCSFNWSAAKFAEEDKIHVFEQTDIFVLACWHSFVVCIAEMKHSGELYGIVFYPCFMVHMPCGTRYSLAAVEQILKSGGNNYAIGCDIGCALSVTVANSILGEQAGEVGF